MAAGSMARVPQAACRRGRAAVLASHDRTPRSHGRLGAPRDLLRLPGAVRRDRDPRLRHRLPHAGVRRQLLPRQLLPDLQGSPERVRDRPDRRPAGDDDPARVRAPGQARLRAPGPGSRRSPVRPAGVRDRRLGVRRDAARHRADRLPARRRADRDVGSGLRRHPVRRLDRRPGADRRQRLDARGAAPRPVVVPRAARDHLRREHPLHQGRAHAVQLRQLVVARP